MNTSPELFYFYRYAGKLPERTKIVKTSLLQQEPSKQTSEQPDDEEFLLIDNENDDITAHYPSNKESALKVSVSDKAASDSHANENGEAGAEIDTEELKIQEHKEEEIRRKNEKRARIRFDYPSSLYQDQAKETFTPQPKEADHKEILFQLAMVIDSISLKVYNSFLFFS